jgi:ribosome-associated protein
MPKKTVADSAENILKYVVMAMQDKKAKDIISLDLSNIKDSISTYFVICQAPSTTQVDAIYKNVVEKVQEYCSTKPFHIEGYTNSEWILIDYFDVVVHIFRNDIRAYYRLEELWADAVLKRYESDD